MPNFWENDPIASAPQGGAPAPIFTVPDPQRDLENVRDAGRDARDATRLEIDARREVRDISGTAFDQARTLREDFTKLPEVAAYRAALPYFSSGISSEANAQGDLQLINAYAKIMDPGGVVQQGEIDNVTGTLSTAQAAIQSMSREFGIGQGGTFPPEVRNRLRQEMRTRMKEWNNAYNAHFVTAREIAQRYGISPEDVTGPHYGAQFREQWLATRPQAANAPSEQDIARSGDVEFGMDRWGRDDTFDRAAYLQQQYGLERGDEARIIAFWEANVGNQNLTPEAAAQWYAGQGLPLPSPEDLAATVEQAKAGVSGVVGFDTSDAEASYLAQLDEVLAQRGANPESTTGAIGAKAAQGVMWGVLDEVAGVGGAASAVIDGENPLAAYQAERDVIRREQDRAGEAHPYIGTAAELAGGLATGGIGYRSAATMGQAARTAAKQGAVAGFNYGEGAGGSAAGAGMGAALGAGAGAGMFRLGERLAARAAGRATNSSPDTSPPRQPHITAGINFNQRAMPEPPANNNLPPADQEKVVELAKQATGRLGRSRREARQELARMAVANPEAKAAADRLGIELPLDVISDDARLQSLVGLTRSQVGSEAETAWRTTAAEVAEQADEALVALGATDDLAGMNDGVFRQLNSAIDNLQQKAVELRDQVTAAIAPGARVKAENLERAVAGLINDYGGLSEAKAAMTAQERSLLSMLGEGEEAIMPTYARLNRLRDDIGEALNKGKGPWADVNQRQLSKYYRALADDQLAAVEHLGGAELADKQRAANTLFAQMFEQREQMQDVFGKALDKSMAPLLTKALTTGSKGDTKALTTLLSRIPETARGPAVLSGLFSLSRSRAFHGGFSFANYAKLYRGLRANAPVFNKIAQAVGSNGTAVLQDLFVISNRIANAENKVLRTGKANQGMTAAIQAETVVSNVIGATTRQAVTGTATATGAMLGGPIGAAAGATLSETAQRSIANGGASRLGKLHSLLSSPQFLNMVEKIARGEAPDTSIEAVYNSPAFHRLTKSLGIVDPAKRREWLNKITSSDPVIATEALGLQRQISAAFQPSQLAAETEEQAPSGGSRTSRTQETR